MVFANGQSSSVADRIELLTSVEAVISHCAPRDFPTYLQWSYNCEG